MLLLQPSGGLLPVPGPRRRRPDGVAAGRSSRGAGVHGDGDDVRQRVVAGDQQQFGKKTKTPSSLDD